MMQRLLEVTASIEAKQVGWIGLYSMWETREATYLRKMLGGCFLSKYFINLNFIFWHVTFIPLKLWVQWHRHKTFFIRGPLGPLVLYHVVFNRRRNWRIRIVTMRDQRKSWSLLLVLKQAHLLIPKVPASLANHNISISVKNNNRKRHYQHLLRKHLKQHKCQLQDLRHKNNKTWHQLTMQLSKTCKRSHHHHLHSNL